MIIGIGGYAQSGKDFMGDYLVHKYGFIKMKFAEPLYRIAFSSAGWDPNESTNAEQQEAFKRSQTTSPLGSMTGRKLLQTLGTDILRNGYPAIWVDLMDAKLARLPYGKDVVITDCRFANEVELVTETFGGIWVRIHSSVATKPAHNHLSETEQDSLAPDYELFNNHDESYLPKIDTLMRKLHRQPK